MLPRHSTRSMKVQDLTLFPAHSKSRYWPFFRALGGSAFTRCIHSRLSKISRIGFTQTCQIFEILHFAKQRFVPYKLGNVNSKPSDVLMIIVRSISDQISRFGSEPDCFSKIPFLLGLFRVSLSWHLAKVPNVTNLASPSTSSQWFKLAVKAGSIKRVATTLHFKSFQTDSFFIRCRIAVRIGKVTAKSTYRRWRYSSEYQKWFFEMRMLL